eukprot:CAMPEP_0182422074 /NCGR_PEP_ID=MMETSP1167-20130531/7640_1 /TAXON_ID=2988 /ORGANISM="Mallomonas Sp, Strain CCMP3275" /LENGTH=304 /DNA_ID=CAMNT_0024599815 /DNA_START=473 /DNA_END=1387 /DNA_ORIENTATION=+
MLEPSVTELLSEDELQGLVEKESVIFLLVRGTDQNANHEQISDHFSKVASKLRTETVFATIQSNDSFTTIQRREKYRAPLTLQITLSTQSEKESKRERERERESRSNEEVSADEAMITSEDIEVFVRENKYPLITILDSHSFSALTKMGRRIVILVVDYTRADSSVLVDGFITAVRSQPHEFREMLLYGILDGIQFGKFAKNHDASANAILVLDPQSDMHYATSSPDDLSEDGFRLLLRDLLKLPGYGDRPMRLSISAEPGYYGSLKRKLREYFPWSLLCLLPMMLWILSCFVPYPEDEKEKQS